LHERIYDRLLEQDGRAMLYFPVANFSGGNAHSIQKMLEHPFTVVGLGDAGAHYGLICDASYPTYMLTRWARDASPESRQELSKVVRALTSQPASVVGLNDRGLVRPGYKADMNVIDFDRLRLDPPDPVRDLPANGLRLHQRADGYVATIVSGKVTYRDGEPTGELPGRLVRSARPAPLAA
jgi:N-acyl-D-aspartate/D-glutamate deacylase